MDNEPRVAPMQDETRAREVLARRFADLKILSQKASDGAWLHYDKVFRKQFGKGRVTEIQRYGDGKPIVNWAGFDGLPDVTARKKNQNARFIVELVNFFRKHADDLGALLAFAAPPAGEREDGYEFADKLMNWLNALDTADMQAKDVRSAVFHWALSYRPSHPHQADREAIARVISPEWFGEIDGCHVLDNYPGQHKEYQAKALAKADAILALSPTPSAGRDGGGECAVSPELAARLEPAPDIQPFGQPKLSSRRIKRKSGA